MLSLQVEVVVEKTPSEAGSSPKKKGGAGKGVKNSGAGSGGGGGGAALTAADRKVCLWPTGSGTTCGKTFTKFDSLKRHLSEAHKGESVGLCG